jgi:hypothetical protein
LDRLVPLAGRDDDHFVTEPRRCAQLCVDVSPNAAAARCIESANVDDPHGEDKRAARMKLK